jgi:predicted ribosome quality control (RQC) complex YloA/Tae2 family protein
MEDDDDLIIDLTGMEAALDADIADPALEDDEDDEDVIDLLDAVEPEALAAETDELADLETRAETMLAETLDSPQEPDIGIAEETSPAFADPSDEEFAPTALSQPSTTDTVPFTEQQLEAALERTIRRIYAEKIEHLMFQTIEKTVQREIEKIKRALLEDDDELSD